MLQDWLVLESFNLKLYQCAERCMVAEGCVRVGDGDSERSAQKRYCEKTDLIGIFSSIFLLEPSKALKKISAINV